MSTLAHPTTPPPRRRRGWVRALRSLGLVLSVLALIVAVVVGSFLSSSSLRGQVLDAALPRVVSTLPGTLSIERTAWPKPGRVELMGILWRDDADTLLACDRALVDVRLRPLVRKDVHLNAVIVNGLFVNLPGLLAQFPASEDTVSAPASSEPPSFPRPGSFRPMPSVALDSLWVDARSIVLPDTTAVLDLAVGLELDLGAGRPPHFALTHLAGRAPTYAASVDDGDAHGVLGPWELGGAIRFGVEGVPLQLALSTPGNNTVGLALRPQSSAQWGLALQVALPPGGETVDIPSRTTVTGRLITPTTAELRELPWTATAAEGLPELEALAIDLAADLSWSPELAGSAEIRLESNPWLEGGLIRAQLRGTSITLDTLDVRLPGLSVAAQAKLDDTTVDATTQILCTNLVWATRLMRDGAPVDSLAFVFQAHAQGSRTAPDIAVSLQGGARIGSTTLDSFAVEATVLGLQEASFGLDAELHDLFVDVQGNATWGEVIDARLTPIRVLTRRPTGQALPMSTQIRFVPAEQSLLAEDIRMLGDLGDLTASASIRNGNEGTVNFNWSAVSPPSFLTNRIGHPAARDSLVARWNPSEPPYLRVDATLTPGANGPQVEAQGSLRLPGPGDLRVFFPSAASVDALGPIRGTFAGRFASQPEGPEFEVQADFGDTQWIDALRVVAHGSDGNAVLDSLQVSVEGIHATASGTFAETLDGHLRIQVDHLDLLRDLLGNDTMEGTATLDAHVTGTRDAPQAQGTLVASGAYAGHTVSALQLDAGWNDGALDASLTAAASLLDNALELDHIGLTARSEQETLFPLRLDLALEGPSLGQRTVVTLDQDGETWDAQFDTLRVRLEREGLGNEEPFRVRVNPSSQELQVDGLALSGPIGFLRVDGTVAPSASDITVLARAKMPPPPKSLQIPETMGGSWPDSLYLDLRATGTSTLDGLLRVTGVDYANRTDVTTTLEIVGRDSLFSTTLRLTDQTHDLLQGTFSAPARVTFSPPGLVVRSGDLQGDIRFVELPLAISRRDPDRYALADGRIRLGGTTSAPTLSSNVDLEFPGWAKLGAYTAEVQAEFGTPHSDGDALDRDLLRPAQDLPTGARLGFAIRKDQSKVLSGVGNIPMSLTLVPFSYELPVEVPLHVEAHAPELQLGDFDELLPPDIGLDGTLALEMTADGPRENLAFGGSIEFQKLAVNFAAGSRVVMGGQLALGGTLDRPSVRGALEVENGIIKVPEMKKSLHELAGEAALWENTGWSPTPLDTAVVEIDSLAVASKAPELDLDVRLIIPGNVWIRGRNMELELSGDLKLVQQGAVPAVTGQLKVLRGTLMFVGRRFEVERGDVFFYGGNDLNPSLDLQLRADVNPYTFTIELRGTALEPELTLSSAPEQMSEGDILSYLVFGSKSNSLKEGQAEMVGRLAAGYASAELTERLSGQLGVDMVNVNVGDGDKASSVSVGKYLTNQILLKYEQSLDQTKDFFLNLEYSLTRTIKVSSLYGSQQSGVELRWSKDY